MAGLSLKADFDMSFLAGLMKAFPQASAGVLHAVGYEGRQILRKKLLAGQYINLTKFPKDKRGRRTVNYKIFRNFKDVKISSYPLNLHDPRKAYRKLSPLVASQLNEIVSKYDAQKFQKIIDQYDKK